MQPRSAAMEGKASGCGLRVADFSRPPFRKLSAHGTDARKQRNNLADVRGLGTVDMTAWRSSVEEVQCSCLPVWWEATTTEEPQPVRTRGVTVLLRTTLWRTRTHARTLARTRAWTHTHKHTWHNHLLCAWTIFSCNSQTVATSSNSRDAPIEKRFNSCCIQAPTVFSSSSLHFVLCLFVLLLKCFRLLNVMDTVPGDLPLPPLWALQATAVILRSLSAGSPVHEVVWSI